MLYSHWLSPGLEQRPGPGPGRMGCMLLRGAFHTAPEQGQGRMGYVPIFQVLKLFQVVCFNCISMAFTCLVLIPDTASVNGFCIILVPVPVPSPVPETASVYTPLRSLYYAVTTLFGAEPLVACPIETYYINSTIHEAKGLTVSRLFRVYGSFTLHGTGTGTGTGQSIGFYVMLCTVHTTQG